MMTVADFHWQMLLQLAVAGVFGALIGYEREREGKPAGVRTQA